MAAIKKHLLFAFSGEAVFEQFLELSKALEKTGQFKSIFWSPNKSDSILLETVKLKGCNNAFKKKDEVKSIKELKQDTTKKNNDLLKVPKKNELSVIWLPKQLIIAFIDALNYRKVRRKMKVFIKQTNVDCIIVSDERSPKFLPLVAEAKKLNKPVLLLPSNYICMPDGGAMMRRESRELFVQIPWKEAFRKKEIQLSLLNHFTALLFPKQVFKSNWGGMLCYPARDILSLFMAGLLPHKLWYQGTRFAKKIIVSGDEELEVCRVAEISNEKIVKIGNPIFEMLQKKMEERVEKRNELSRQLRFSPESKIIVFAIPVAWEHKMITREEQFSVLENVLRMLSGNEIARYNRPVILISLHPKSNKKDYIELSNRYGAHIVEENLSEILSVADYFIAGAYSSTIRWALALKIPAINLDFWGMKESTYDRFKDFPTVTKIQGISDWYKKVSNDSNDVKQYNNMSLGIVSEKGFYKRMYNLIKSVT